MNYDAVLMINAGKGFHGMGIAPGILDILEKMKITVPTPIQERSIPVAMEKNDMMGIAQTGTGKTLAFGIPLVQHALQGAGLALVVVPTRELALQVGETLFKIGAKLNIRTATLIGGEVMWRQIKDLRRGPHIVVGTPGRIIDHMEQKNVSFAKLETLVLDEADRMLDMGFAPQLNRILAAIPHKRQTMFFSATMPQEIVKMASRFLRLPVRIEIARAGTAAENVTHEIFFVPQEEKPRLLEKILYDYKGSVLVFLKMKHSAKRIATQVRAMGHTAAEIHSNRTLNQRREALDGFKAGRYRVLVATDIAARGIDVSNIELIINYDLPSAPEDYVHRIGRTGRAGRSGHAISFARPNERRDVQTIERLTHLSLPISRLPELPPRRMERTSERAERAVKSRTPDHGRAPAGRGPRRPAPRKSFRPRGR